MSLHKQFATNKEAEVQGIWVEYGPNDDGTVPAFKIARMGKSNKKYTKAFQKITRPHRKAMQLETLPEEQAEKMMLEVFVGNVLLDWRNVQSAEGEVLTFTKDVAIELMEDLDELYEDLQEKAQKVSMFRDSELEEEAGN